jgi:urease accessory protein
MGMLAQQKSGNINTVELNGREIDWLPLEWYETAKRVMRKRTRGGKDIAFKFLNENPQLGEGDIVWEDEVVVVAITVLPCNCIVVQPDTMFEMASLCYEIGNKHLPLFYEQEQLLVPFEMPLYKLLLAQGYKVQQQSRQLLNPLRTTVSPHGHAGSESLFSKIMKLKTGTA